MRLEILSPEKIYLSAEVTMVTLPGKQGRFTVLENHAPIISMLQKGMLVYQLNGQDQELSIGAGFVEVNNNKVVVCIEQVNND